MYNLYDDEDFYAQYAHMPRSEQGLVEAGEWHQMRKLFPDVEGKEVLDLGCGYGWHCEYAMQQGAKHVLGIDVSTKMIEEALEYHAHNGIEYRVCALDAYEYPVNTYDLVVSNLVLHYIEDLKGIYERIYRTLKPGGVFLFNIEHPVFTSGVNQDWIYDEEGKPLYWPLDHYFRTGERKTNFLDRKVIKQHHTLTQILMGLLECGFQIQAVQEAMPDERMLEIPGMKEELRRPMMLLVKVAK